VPQAPQFSGSLLVDISQPSVGSPLQSALQDKCIAVFAGLIKAHGAAVSAVVGRWRRSLRSRSRVLIAVEPAEQAVFVH
jgi:hypothetical protein